MRSLKKGLEELQISPKSLRVVSVITLDVHKRNIRKS